MIDHQFSYVFSHQHFYYCIAGKFGKLTLLSIRFKKVWRINSLANSSLIVSTNLHDISSVNHGRFAKFAKLFCSKLSCYTLVIDSKTYY